MLYFNFLSVLVSISLEQKNKNKRNVRAQYCTIQLNLFNDRSSLPENLDEELGRFVTVSVFIPNNSGLLRDLSFATNRNNLPF